MPKINIDQIFFYEDLRKAIFPSLVFIVFMTGFLTYLLNSPISHEELSGTILHNATAVGPKDAASAITFIELENGRVVSVSIPVGATLPQEGKQVTVVRYIKRFFGDSFGLKQ